MINNSIHIFDGIYCTFNYLNETIVLGSPTGGYKAPPLSSDGKTVSYLARTSQGLWSEWEIGIGQIEKVGEVLHIKRVKILSSSNNDNPVNFTNLINPVFCVLPNQYNFNTGFNNLITKESDFDIDTVKTTYYVDSSKQNIRANLPSAANTQGLIIELKTISSDNSVKIYAQDNETIEHQKYLTLSNDKKYTRLISTGLEWIELLNEPRDTNYSVSSIDNSLSLLSVGPSGSPGGDALSLQYNATSGFDGAPAFFSVPNILLGADTTNSAVAILPLSNHLDVVFNNLKGSGNFIVNGLSSKNLFFDYTGKLGVNIPSGLKPAAALHINNNGCVDGIRLDNRNNCYPATLTLYHRPSTVPSSGSIASVINLAGKNSVSNQINYVQLKSRILDSAVGYTQGEFSVGVENAGQITEVMTINKNKFTVSIGSSSINLSASGTTIDGPVTLNNLDLDAGIIVFTGLSSDNSPVLTPTPTPTITVTSTPTLTPTPTPTQTLNT